MPPWLNTLINTGQGIMRTPAAQHMTKMALNLPLIQQAATFMDEDRLSDRQKMQADQFGAGDINFSDTEKLDISSLIPGHQPLGFVDGGRDFSEFDYAKMGNPTEGVVRDYLGAGSPMLDYEGNESGYNFTDNYDPAFGALSSYISGDTSYPQQNEPYRTETFDEFEEIPSLQRRLGNERFSLGQPQNLGFEEESKTISTPVYQDRIMNRNLPGFAYEPQYRIRDQLKRDFLQGGLFRDAKQSLGQTKDAFLEDVGGMQEGLGYLKNKAGQGWDFAKQLPQMAMSALTGIPFLGQMLGGLGNMFEDRQLTGDIMDEYGNMYSAEDLNKMNAKGGWYTDAARSARRRTSRIANMRQRLEKDKKISHKNLHELVRQEKAQQLRNAKDAADRANIQNIQNYTGRELSDYRMSRPASERGFTGHGKSGMGRDPDDRMARGGRVGYANGGLASLFTRRG